MNSEPEKFNDGTLVVALVLLAIPTALVILDYLLGNIK
jgi:hypothetical protein